MFEFFNSLVKKGEMSLILNGNKNQRHVADKFKEYAIGLWVQCRDIHAINGLL